jgi:hypothetical protein
MAAKNTKRVSVFVAVLMSVVSALALTDGRLAELDTAATAAEAKLKELGDGANEVYKNLVSDVATKARNMVMAERRKRRMVGDHVVVASFDAQMGQLDADYEAAVSRLREYEAAGTNSTSTAAGAGAPPLPAGL